MAADYRKCTECVQRFYSFVSGDWSFYLTPQGRCNRCVTKGCSKEGTCNPDGTCRTCDEGFGKVGNKCLKCTMPNCCISDSCNVYVDGSACNSDGTCKECDRDYIRQGTKCVPKPKCLTKNCITCVDVKVCTECDGGFFLSANKTCVPCKGECGLCNPRNPAQCTECYLGYGLVTATKKCVKHCAECNGTGLRCSGCFIGEGPDGKGGCKSCDNLGCSSCDASSAVCTECDMRRTVYEGSTPYFWYFQLDGVANQCVRIYREKNTIPDDSF
ncbi:hypothetical protein ABPG75_001237 [Micractinium tetrahymenae]